MHQLSTATAINTDEEKEENEENNVSLIEKVNTCWCVTARCARGGLPEELWNKLSNLE